MTPSDLSQATNEELLRRVIAAQRDGGCDKFERAAKSKNWIEDEGINNNYVTDGISIIAHVLEILLDTQGARAAYGDEGKIGRSVYTGKGNYPFWEAVSKMILESWHCGEGNNVHAALLTAVSFLPEK